MVLRGGQFLMSESPLKNLRIKLENELAVLGSWSVGVLASWSLSSNCVFNDYSSLHAQSSSLRSLLLVWPLTLGYRPKS